MDESNGSNVGECSGSQASELQQQTSQAVSTIEITPSTNENQVPTHDNDGTPKSHKVEGKNKKSLHQKQKQLQQRKQQPQSPKQTQQPNSNASNGTRRGLQNNLNALTKPQTGSISCNNSTIGKDCSTFSTLEEFSKRAQELKEDINQALEKQASRKITDQPVEVVELKNDILKLSGLDDSDKLPSENKDSSSQECIMQDNLIKREDEVKVEEKNTGDSIDSTAAASQNTLECENRNKTVLNCQQQQQQTNPPSQNYLQQVVNIKSSQENITQNNDELVQQKDSIGTVKSNGQKKAAYYKSDTNLTKALDKLTMTDSKNEQVLPQETSKRSGSKRQNLPHTKTNLVKNSLDQTKSCESMKDEFESLNAKLDLDSKFVALYSSLQKHFIEAPQLLEPICRKLVSMNEQNSQLASDCEKFQSENQRLNSVRQKLENLCRELQKSNNAIRIESLDLIKIEQGKAKEQTTKIQSTLSGVIKLFDENQQRNMSLRQENQELQLKLKSLLDHCDNWEKSVEAALRQRDIENRLIKTELAKANLLKNEEKEKFLGEKQELLQILSIMQEQQHRIEGQEAKLRSDLSSYASKYDECQAVISKGMNRFQTESKRMLKQIEKSKQDYKVLLSKYESSNKRMVQLLEEKQCWDRAMNLANKKIETLERLCRALSDRKITSNKNSDDETNIKKMSTRIKSNKCQKEDTSKQQELQKSSCPSDKVSVDEDKTKGSIQNVTANGSESVSCCKSLVEEAVQDIHESYPNGISILDKEVEIENQSTSTSPRNDSNSGVVLNGVTENVKH